jgi:hypothetical protein
VSAQVASRHNVRININDRWGWRTITCKSVGGDIAPPHMVHDLAMGRCSFASTATILVQAAKPVASDSLAEGCGRVPWSWSQTH